MHARSFVFLCALMSTPFLHATSVYTSSSQWSQAADAPLITENLGNKALPNGLIASADVCAFGNCLNREPSNGVLDLSSYTAHYGTEFLTFAKPVYSIGFDVDMSGADYGGFAVIVGNNIIYPLGTQPAGPYQLDPQTPDYDGFLGFTSETPITSIEFAGSYSLTLSDISLATTPAPEPGSMMLVGGAGVLVALLRKKRGSLA